MNELKSDAVCLCDATLHPLKGLVPAGQFNTRLANARQIMRMAEREHDRDILRATTDKEREKIKDKLAVASKVFEAECKLLEAERRKLMHEPLPDTPRPEVSFDLKAFQIKGNHAWNAKVTEILLEHARKIEPLRNAWIRASDCRAAADAAGNPTTDLEIWRNTLHERMETAERECEVVQKRLLKEREELIAKKGAVRK